MATVIEVSVSFDVGTQKASYVAGTTGASLNVIFSGHNSVNVVQSSTESSVPMGDTAFAILGRKPTRLAIADAAEHVFEIKKTELHPDVAIATLVVGSYEGLKLGVQDAFDEPQSTIFFWG